MENLGLGIPGHIAIAVSFFYPFGPYLCPTKLLSTLNDLIISFHDLALSKFPKLGINLVKLVQRKRDLITVGQIRSPASFFPTWYPGSGLE